MSNENTLDLARAYKTLKDYIEDKNPIDPDELVMHFCPSDIELNFYKSGFDVALIITDKSLIKSVTTYQMQIQSGLGLITHCIILSSINRLKNLIKDLKMKDIPYAVVMKPEDIKEEICDVYILDPYIEIQCELTIEEMYKLIKDDQKVKRDSITSQLNNRECWPHKHESSNNQLANPSKEMRHLLCLLFDNRMLNINQLKEVKNYLIVCHKALESKQLPSASYNDQMARPLEPMRQQVNKYYFYEPKQSTSNVTSILSNGIMSVTRPPEVNMTSTRSITSGPMNVVTLNSTKYPPPPVVPLMSTILPISAPPSQVPTNNIYSRNTTKPPEPNPTQNPPLPIYNKPATEVPKVGEAIKPSNIGFKHQKIKFNINKKAPDASIEDFAVVSCASTSSATSVIALSTSTPNKSIPNKSTPTKSTVNPKINDKPLTPYTCQISPVSSDEESNKANRKRKSSNEDLASPSKKQNLTQNESATIELSDNEEVDPKCANSAGKVQSLDTVSSNQLSEDAEDKDAYLSVSSIQLVNLFQLILELAEYGLPNNNEVSRILQRANKQLSENIPDVTARNVPINQQQCATMGFIELITNIHELCDDLTPNFALYSNLDYAWTHLFPRTSIIDNHLLVLFYRFIKLLISFKISNKFKSTMRQVYSTLREIKTAVQCDLSVDHYNIASPESDQLDCLAELFPIYYKQRDKLHTIKDFDAGDIKQVNDSPNKSTNYDHTILSYKIKYVMFPIFEYFIKTINAIHIKMSDAQLEFCYSSIHTLRFCLRKICPLIINTKLEPPKSANIKSPLNPVEAKKQFIEKLKSEIFRLVTDMKKFKAVIFSEKHYEFINCILDATLLIEGQLMSPPAPDVEYQPPWLAVNQQNNTIICVNLVDFLSGFVGNKATVKLAYHPETELAAFRSKMRQHWADVLFQAMGGSEPDGARIYGELRYLLPQPWQLFTFDEAVGEAIASHFTELTGLFDQPLDQSTNIMSVLGQTRYSALIWMDRYQLPVKKMLEELNKNHLQMDQLIVKLYDNTTDQAD